MNERAASLASRRKTLVRLRSSGSRCANVDVGDNGIELGPGANQVTVNPGVREDAVDAILTKHNLMFKTVTAGGFFSLGGMTAVDVHGGTVDAPIFAETASSFTILGADMGGFTHNGKMYGFYDPTKPAGTYTPAFNTNFSPTSVTAVGTV